VLFLLSAHDYTAGAAKSLVKYLHFWGIELRYYETENNLRLAIRQIGIAELN